MPAGGARRRAASPCGSSSTEALAVVAEALGVSLPGGLAAPLRPAAVSAGDCTSDGRDPASAADGDGSSAAGSGALATRQVRGTLAMEARAARDSALALKLAELKKALAAQSAGSRFRALSPMFPLRADSASSLSLDRRQGGNGFGQAGPSSPQTCRSLRPAASEASRSRGSEFPLNRSRSPGRHFGKGRDDEASRGARARRLLALWRKRTQAKMLQGTRNAFRVCDRLHARTLKRLEEAQLRLEHQEALLAANHERLDSARRQNAELQQRLQEALLASSNLQSIQRQNAELQQRLQVTELQFQEERASWSQAAERIAAVTAPGSPQRFASKR